MKTKKINIVYFSATGTTKKIANTICESICAEANLPTEVIDFTLPAARENVYSFSEDDFVLFAVPVYAGRIPNVLQPFVHNNIKGADTPAAAVVVYGNRAFDDALLECKYELSGNGFTFAAGAAFVAEHSFSTTLGGGRPDAYDIEKAKEFGKAVADKIRNDAFTPITLPDEHELMGYHRPDTGEQNKSALEMARNFAKAKPVITEKCTNCGLCAALCPMGSINPDNVAEVKGICIKCCACIKKCPNGARVFDNPGFIFHKEHLENNFMDRKEPVTFI